MHDLAERLRDVIAHEEALLRAVDEAAASAVPQPPRWSKKQELGHLIDSATMNRVRFATAAVDGQYQGPSYAQESWVELGGYGDLAWAGIIDLWKALNQAMAELLSRIPDSRRTAACRIGSSPEAPLEFVADDYIQHMQHHLDQILGRENVRSYPSARR